MRKICYITGTRADFGLMKYSLQAIDQDEELKLEVVVTGMHLLSEYGNTYQYDLSKPLDRIKYKTDLDAQLRDRITPNPYKDIERFYCI